MWIGEMDLFEVFDFVCCMQQFFESLLVFEFDVVGVYVLFEQGDFDCVVFDEEMDFVQDVVGVMVFFFVLQVWDDVECVGVVVVDGD